MLHTPHSFKTIIYLFFAFFPVLGTAQTSSTAAAVEEFPTIQYDRGALKANSLPYSKKFYIKGSAILPSGDTADFVVIQICDLAKKNKEDTVESFWFKSANQIEFDLLIDPLELDRDYQFTIYFFKNKFENHTLLTSVIASAVSYYDNKQYLAGDTTKKVILRELDRINRGDLSQPRFRTPLINASLQQVKINYEAVALLADSINAYVQARKDSTNSKHLLDVLVNTWGNMSEDSVAIGKLLTELKKDTAAIRHVRGFLVSGTLDTAITSIKFTSRDPGTQQFFNSMIDLYNQLNKISGDYREAKSRALSTRQNLLQLVEKLENGPAILNSYSLFTSSAGPASTDVDKLRIHTDYGIAATNFNSPLAKDRALFGYTALKIYFVNLDKTVRSPYRNHFERRLSFLLGAVTPSKLTYRGQELDNLDFINMKLVFGLSIDVTKYFSFNIGTVSFRQADPNPLSDLKYTRFSPFISVAFDFDVVNRLRELNP